MLRLPTALFAAAVLAGCFSGEPNGTRSPESHQVAVDSVWYEHTMRSDHAGAIGRLERLAASGNPIAMRALGTTYMDGIGVDPDFEAAARWFRLAAEHGDSTAAEAIRAYDDARPDSVQT